MMRDFITGPVTDFLYDFIFISVPQFSYLYNENTTLRGLAQLCKSSQKLLKFTLISIAANYFLKYGTFHFPERIKSKEANKAMNGAKALCMHQTPNIICS